MVSTFTCVQNRISRSIEVDHPSPIEVPITHVMGEKKKVIPPDGGWGWMVVLGVSICNFSMRSLEPSFGLLFGDLLYDLHVETTGAAVITSIMDAMINFSGIFVGPLIKTYSYRTVALLGSVLSIIGLIATAPAESTAHIIITYSIIRGLGAGFGTSSCIIAINNFFLKKRGQAVGLSMAGTAVGFMLLPQAVQLLLQIYGFTGAILVLSGINLHAIVGALLLQPVQWHMNKTSIHIENDEKEVARSPSRIWADEEQNIELLKIGESMNGEIIGASISREPVAGGTSSEYNKKGTHKNDREVEEEEALVNKNLIQIKPSSNKLSSDQTSINRRKLTIWQRVSKFMDFDLLKDPIYLNIVAGISIFFVAEVNFKMIVPFFMADLGYTKSETAFCLSIMAVSDIAARVLIPPICDRFSTSKRMLFLVSALLLGISRSILAEQTSYVAILVTISVSGLFRGSTLINFSLSISEHCSLEKLPAAIGLQMVARGLFSVALGPVVGAIRDVSGSYPLCIHFQTLLIFISCLAWGIEFIIIRFRKPKDANKIIG